MLRLPQYVNMVRDGQVEPEAELVVLDESECGGRLSGQWNYGPVTATAAVRWVLDKVGDGAVAVAGVRDCNHVARLGRFAEIATRADCIVLIAAMATAAIGRWPPLAAAAAACRRIRSAAAFPPAARGQ